MKRLVFLLAALGVSAALTVTGAAWTGEAAAPSPEAVKTREDMVGRVVAPVYVNGQGPFRFIVDTGANRSGLSHDLAAKLGLEPYGTGEVHAITGVETAPLVQVDALRSGDFSLNNATVPLLGNFLLAGGDGMLGADGMNGKRLFIDVAHDRMTITESKKQRAPSGWLTLKAKLRFGQLVVTEGKVGKIPVKIVIDTGADRSLANPALRAQIIKGNGVFREPHSTGSRVTSAAAPIVAADGMILPMIELAGVNISNTTVLVADFYVFHLWDLQNEPAIVLGMDVLGRTKAVAIDYERKEVQLKL